MESDNRDSPLPEGHTGPLTRHIVFLGRPADGMEAPALEGNLQVPLDGALHPGVVLCHANPAAGGHKDMKTMLAIEAALSDAGIATLRYNSRGVGESSGAISRSETEDIGSALAFLAMQQGVDMERLALVGHSFGSRISLAYVASHIEDQAVRAVVCIGLPVAWRSLAHLGQWPHPKLFITGERDDFSPPEKLAEFVATLPEPKTIVTLKRTGHFFEGRENDLAAVVAGFLKELL